MIKIPREVDYAIQFLRFLEKQSIPLSLRICARELQISFLFLQQIARKLKHAGFIQADQGSKGGYTLIREISGLSLKELIDIISGPIGITTCHTPGKKCHKETACDVKPLFEKLNEQFLNMLSRTPIAK